MRAKDLFTTIRTEGGLLPADLLQRIVNRDRDLEAITPEHYHLGVGERINEAISRSWNRLINTWQGFQETINNLPESDLGTRATRERWLLILFQELGYGRLPTFKAVEIEGKSYPVSHMWQQSPIHLVSFRVDLDRRQAGVAGAARTSPHSLVQEFLNRSEDHLWGFVSNGLRLRILRDNISLTRQAFVEFDLEAMMEGEVFADFALMWMLCHQSRVEAEKPEECWLEKWTKVAQDQGTRALKHLREGVEKAIETLGAGFLANPANMDLREKLWSGALSTQDYYRQLLRTVYRLLFLFVAEDRGLLFDPNADSMAQERYQKYYSTSRLRRLAEKRRGTKHTDLYHGLKLVMRKLGDPQGCPELALPALGSYLWSDKAAPELDVSEIANRDLLEAVRALAFIVDQRVFRSIDYKNLGSEELGSVYESLLELHPEVNTQAATFALTTAGGHERKTTGSYYTPKSLVQALLDSALDPVLDEAGAKDNPEQAILALKVCDPACGSGHFLIAAAHRMAKRLAFVRTGDEEPSPEAIQHALRDVISHCIYGVDINPMAVELCKVSLWMEALEPGRPLSFLEHRIQCGNSLLGATPALLDNGIPDEAFKPIEGDDKEVCTEFKKRNKEERQEQYERRLDLDGTVPPWESQGNLAVALLQLDDIDDSGMEGIRRKQELYEQLVRSDNYYSGKFLADAWCAAFVIKKVKDPEKARPITEDDFRRIEKNPHDVNYEQKQEIQRLAREYQFFHYHLAFPDVFYVPGKNENVEKKRTGWSRGFACILGNPPWEAEELIEKEFFGKYIPEIIEIKTKARRSELINSLTDVEPELFCKWINEKRNYAARSHFYKNSTLYPAGAQGKLNTYRLFAELSYGLINNNGRMAEILKSGIVTAQDSQNLFQQWSNDDLVVALFDFINTKLIFPDVVPNERFCLLTLSGVSNKQSSAKYLFGLTEVAQLSEKQRIIRISSNELKRVNPDDRSIPPAAGPKEYTLLTKIHVNTSILRSKDGSVNYWELHYSQGHLNSANGSTLFKDYTLENLLGKGGVKYKNSIFIEDVEYLALYEGKYISQLNHRFGTFEGVSPQRRFGTKAEANSPVLTELENPEYEIIPRYWLKYEDALNLYSMKKSRFGWLFSFRDVCRAIVDARTVQSCVLPKYPCLDGCPLLIFDCNKDEAASNALIINSTWSSFVFDFSARQKIHGAHLTKAIAYQLPIPKPKKFNNSFIKETFKDFIYPRILELTVVTHSLTPFAQDCDYEGPPFKWDEYRRFLLRCEMDAALFHLYLGTPGEWNKTGSKELLEFFPTSRDAVDYIMETFPIVKKKDIQNHDEYRTKLTILKMYDQMQEAIDTGRPYQTWLNPPPGPPTDEEGNFISMYLWDRNSWPLHIHPMHRDWEVSILEAWFGLRQKRWVHVDGDQIFPWDGRESFVYALIPYLVQEQPDETYEFYQDAALLAARPDRCETLFLDDGLKEEYRQARERQGWLQFPDAHHARIRRIRETLLAKQIIQIGANTGLTNVHVATLLPPLPIDLKVLMPLFLKAVNNLKAHQQNSLSKAEASKIGISYDEIQAELIKLTA